MLIFIVLSIKAFLFIDILDFFHFFLYIKSLYKYEVWLLGISLAAHSGVVNDKSFSQWRAICRESGLCLKKLL